MNRLTPGKRATTLLMRGRANELRQRHGLKPVKFPSIRDEDKSLMERLLRVAP